MYSLESPRWGDSNEYTLHTISISWLYIYLHLFRLHITGERISEVEVSGMFKAAETGDPHKINYSGKIYDVIVFLL